jgi:hypothetical protein
MLRSIAVGGKSTAAAFLKSLTRDLVKFGRDDVLLFDSGDVTTFVWNPNFVSAASIALREESFTARLVGRRTELAATEALLPPQHFAPFDIDFTNISIDIVACARRSADERLFDYVVEGQSVSAETNKMRIGKFLVYDRTPNPARVMGAIALKSPMYFDGARDSYLNWPPLFTMVKGERVKNQPAIDLRNTALKSIFNISVCMPVAPYDRHGFGKLIAALALSRPVIEHMEATYHDPVLGLTTTGAWGGSAGQYEKIRLGRDIVAGLRGKLFERTHGVGRSLNFALDHFSPDTFDLALEMMKGSHEPARRYRDYRSDRAIRYKLLFTACRYLRIPHRAIASNAIAHYFGSVSAASRHALATINALTNPPMERSINVTEIYAEWRARTNLTPLVGVSALRISDLVK